MKYLKFSIIVFGLFLMFQKANAQQEPMYSQYMFNPLSVNPAYAGSAEVLSITAISRHQWIGFDGAPTTQTLSIHSPVALNLGAGLSLTRDRVGPLDNLGVTASASYNIKLSMESKLYFGLSAGVNNVKFGFNNAANTENDPMFFQDMSSTKPVFGTGLYFLHSRAFAGFSIPDLIASEYDDGGSTWKKERHYYLSGGAIFNLGESLKYRPTTMVKWVPNAPISAELTNTFIIKDFLWLGFMYRLNDALGALVSVQVTEQLRIGYAADFSLNEIGAHNNGTHEIMLNYDFRFGKKYENPRYF